MVEVGCGVLVVVVVLAILACVGRGAREGIVVDDRDHGGTERNGFREVVSICVAFSQVQFLVIMWVKMNILMLIFCVSPSV